MKETTKASIGGCAFTFDKDAYEALNTYLENIRLHFTTKADGNEIVTDIEYRMCELLQMKVKSIEEIVTLADTQDIISMMGNPMDFEENELANDKTIKAEKTTIKKRLYRDKDNSIIGGVCSGLSRYFHIDPVLIRAGFLVAVILGRIISTKISILILLTYIILWIVTPVAKTIVQKLAMSGGDPTIESIESGTTRIRRKSDNHLWTITFTILKVLCFIPLFLAGVSMTIALLAIPYFLYVLETPSINDVLATLGITSSITTFLFILWIVPAFMLIYISIKVITKFRKKDLLLCVTAFVIWFIAFGFVLKTGLKQAKLYTGKSTVSEIIKMDNIDSLYIKIDDSHRFAEPLIPNTPLYLLDKNKVSWFVLPTIIVDKDSSFQTIDFEVKTTAFAKNNFEADNKTKNTSSEYLIQDSLLIIKPQVYSAQNIWNREIFEIIIHCPIDKKVIIQEPIKGWNDPEYMKHSNYIFNYNINSEY